MLVTEWARNEQVDILSMKLFVGVTGDVTRRLNMCMEMEA
jgi:hypothetical protein